MSRPPKEGLGWAAALAAPLPIFLAPVFNPDLFWHLSAGRWMAANGKLPDSEFLSFTLTGRRWLDFEWLSQLLFFGMHHAAGMFGVWLLKVSLMAACWTAFDRALRVNGLGSKARAAGLLAWALAALPWSDARPELFTVLLFTLCLARLEAFRLQRVEAGPRLAGEAAALFALWSNLHAGFPFGLTLIGIYVAGEAVSGRWRRGLSLAPVLLAAAVGALANPYGWGPYKVAFEHFAQRSDLSRFIAEWRPMAPDNPAYFPFYGLAVMCLLAMAARLSQWGKPSWRRPVPWAPIFLCGHFAANAMLHRRVGAFFGVAAALLLAVVFEEAKGWARKAFYAGLAAGLLFAGWLFPRQYWRGFFNPKFVPERAAAFMAAQQPAFSSLRLYNEWGWGGYLGWTLAPWYRAYVDGRYLFHGKLRQVHEAQASAASWQDFLAAERLNGALVPNRDSYVYGLRQYPDGTTKEFKRPWYVSYFPKDRWALVHWDEKALLFVDRKSVPAPWVAAHEYRWYRPKDEDAFEDALSRGEIPPEEWEAEKQRLNFGDGSESLAR